MQDKRRSSYHIIKSRYVTEKTTTLGNLKSVTSNRCVAKCESSKYTFIVDQKANKREIAYAIKAIYPSVTVKAVNTMNVKPKRRRVRGFRGFRSGMKKAIVTLEKGDIIDEEG
ncbi:MAG: 50S ribosomal protein L23 [Chlamydiota bacterium]